MPRNHTVSVNFVWSVAFSPDGEPDLSRVDYLVKARQEEALKAEARRRGWRPKKPPQGARAGR